MNQRLIYITAPYFLVRGRPFRISEFLGGEGVKEIRIFSDMGGGGVKKIRISEKKNDLNIMILTKTPKIPGPYARSW